MVEGSAMQRVGGVLVGCWLGADSVLVGCLLLIGLVG